MSRSTRYNLDKQSMANLQNAINGGGYDPKILHKDFKYFAKTNNLLLDMLNNGKVVPSGFEKYLLPYNPGQTGGSYNATEYQNALQKIVVNMKKSGKTIPVEYEKFLTPVQAGGNVGQLENKQVLGCGCDESDKYKYKAYKYHMKNHELIKQMQAGGKPIPPGYEEYLKPCKLN